MTTPEYVNLDARFLVRLAGQTHQSKLAARLLSVAANLERMDQKSLDGGFAAGLQFAEAKAKAHSNMLRAPSRRLTDEDGETIIAAFGGGEAPVRKVPLGARGLRPAPRVFDLTKTAGPPARKGFRVQDL